MGQNLGNLVSTEQICRWSIASSLDVHLPVATSVFVSAQSDQNDDDDDHHHYHHHHHHQKKKKKKITVQDKSEASAPSNCDAQKLQGHRKNGENLRRSRHQPPGPIPPIWAHLGPSGPLAKVTSLNSSMEISSPVLGENHPTSLIKWNKPGFIKHGWTTIFTWNVAILFIRITCKSFTLIGTNVRFPLPGYLIKTVKKSP